MATSNSNGGSRWWTPASAAAAFCLSVAVSVWLVSNHEAHAQQQIELIREWVQEKVNGHIHLDDERYDRLVNEIGEIKRLLSKK